MAYIHTVGHLLLGSVAILSPGHVPSSSESLTVCQLATISHRNSMIGRYPTSHLDGFRRRT